MAVLVTHLSGLKPSRRVDTRDLGMMGLRRTPVCGEIKFFADIAIILSKTHTFEFIFMVENKYGKAVESGGCSGSDQEASKSETKC